MPKAGKVTRPRWVNTGCAKPDDTSVSSSTLAALGEVDDSELEGYASIFKGNSGYGPADFDTTSVNATSVSHHHHSCPCASLFPSSGKFTNTNTSYRVSPYPTSTSKLIIIDLTKKRAPPPPPLPLQSSMRSPLLYKPDYPSPASSTLSHFTVSAPPRRPRSPTPSPYLATIPPPPTYSPLPPTNTVLDAIHPHVLPHPVPVFDNCDVVRKKFAAFLRAFPQFLPDTPFSVFSVIGPSLPEGGGGGGGGGDDASSSYSFSSSSTTAASDLPPSRFPELLELLAQEHPQCADLGETGFLWFMTLQGERQGMRSCFYYAGYVLFERLRIAKGRKKGEKRRMAEKKVSGVGGWLGWKPKKRTFDRWLRYAA